MKSEHVMCIESEIVDKHLGSAAFTPIESVDISSLFQSDYVWFAPRQFVEHRPDFRQIIPYVILQHNDRLVSYKRTLRGGEKRLHGMLSLGFGGHVSISDAVLGSSSSIDIEGTLAIAANRELHEELHHPRVQNRERLGLLRDNSDDVSRVHLGVVELWTLSEAAVVPSDPTVAECEFISLAALALHMAVLEGWSRLCATFMSERRNSNQREESELDLNDLPLARSRVD